MRSIIIASTFALSALPAMSQDAFTDASVEVKACLNAQAIIYGSQTCLAPSELLPGIYGKCENEMRALANVIKQQSGEGVAERTMTGFREVFNQRLTAFIVDGHIKRECR